MFRKIHPFMASLSALGTGAQVLLLFIITRA